MELGLPELLLILFIVILIFGPGRIAQAGRELGEGLRQFRTGINDGNPVSQRIPPSENDVTPNGEQTTPPQTHENPSIK